METLQSTPVDPHTLGRSNDGRHDPRKWCVQQIVSAHDLPTEVGNHVFAYSGTTTDDYGVAKEIRDLAPFLVEAANKFLPPLRKLVGIFDRQVHQMVCEESKHVEKVHTVCFRSSPDDRHKSENSAITNRP